MAGNGADSVIGPNCGELRKPEVIGIIVKERMSLNKYSHQQFFQIISTNLFMQKQRRKKQFEKSTIAHVVDYRKNVRKFENVN